MRPAHVTVDRRSITPADSPRREVEIDPEVTSGLGVGLGDVIELMTEMGRRTIVRVADPADDLAGTSTILLDRFIRQGLKCRLNERLEVRPASAVAQATSLVLSGPTDLSRAHGYREAIGQSLVLNRTPLSVGAKVYMPLPRGSGGMVFEAVEIEPGDSVAVEGLSIRIEPPEARRAEGQFDTTFEDLGGVGEQVRTIREMLQLPLQMPFVYRQLGIAIPRGLLLYGPPGCGKTEIARALANEVGAKFYFVNGPSLVGTMQGETEGNLRNIFSEAAHHAPAVIVVDELDAVAPHRDQSGSQSNVRAVTAILSMMDGLQDIDGVVVVGTTNRVGAIDTALRRPGRFDQELYVGPPDSAGRLEILEIHSREMPLSDDGQSHLKFVAEHTHGFVGADLKSLCREAGLAAMRRSGYGLVDHVEAFRIDPGDMDVEVLPKDLNEAMRRTRPSASRELQSIRPDATWDDIGGLDALKRRLRGLARMVLQDGRAQGDMVVDAAPTGILLHGAPGTGKTLLARALANDLDVNFLSVDGPSVFSRWLGESEAAVRHVFDVTLQLSPALLLLDQLDALAPRRGGEGASATTERVVSQFITQIDMARERGGVLIVATTNRPELIDPAVLRSGRIGLHLAVPLPDEVSREAIVTLHFVRRGLVDPGDQASLARLVAASEGLSGDDIRQSADLALTEQHLQARQPGSFSTEELVAVITTVRETAAHGVLLEGHGHQAAEVGDARTHH